MKTLVLKEAQAPYTLTLDETALSEGPVQVLQGERVIGVLVPPEEYTAFRAWQEAQHHPQRVGQDHGALEREAAAFAALLPELLREYRGRVVAIHDGQVVEVGHPGESVAQVAVRAYDRLGYVPVYVQQVEETPRVYRITGRSTRNSRACVDGAARG